MIAISERCLKETLEYLCHTHAQDDAIRAIRTIEMALSTSNTALRICHEAQARLQDQRQPGLFALDGR